MSAAEQLLEQGRIGAALAAASEAEAPGLRRRISHALACMPTVELEALANNWPAWARDPQLPPAGPWTFWCLLGGRGSGKTRAAAEQVLAWVRAGARRVAIVAATSSDLRDTIAEGESGLLSISPSWDRPRFEPSKRRLTWANGATATLLSADEPDRIRGGNFDCAWADELCAWKRPEAWDLLKLAVRIGERPRIVVSTTPRPTAQLRAILADPATVASRMSTYDNS